MATIQIDRAKYAEEVGEPIELLDPLPQVAPAAGGITLLPFKLALPTGGGLFEATFEIPEPMLVLQIAVRFGDFQPIYRRSGLNPNGYYLFPCDLLTIYVR